MAAPPSGLGANDIHLTIAAVRHFLRVTPTNDLDRSAPSLGLQPPKFFDDLIMCRAVKLTELWRRVNCLRPHSLGKSALQYEFCGRRRGTTCCKTVGESN